MKNRSVALHTLLAIAAIVVFPEFGLSNTALNESSDRNESLGIVGSYTDQSRSIGGSTSVYADNSTIYTYTFFTPRTPITWTISGGTILSGAGTSTVTVKWTSNNGTLNATSAYIQNGCTTVDPPPSQCCWTPPTGQTCSSPSNPCGNTLMRASAAQSTQGSAEIKGAVVNAVPPGPCCSTVDPPPYQDCNYIRHVGSIATTPLACPVLGTPVPSATQYNIIYGQSATLQASAGAGTTTVRWYAQASGGTLLAEGSSYTTPVINVNAVTYYAEGYASTTPSPICSQYSARVAVTVSAGCPAVGLPTFTVPNTEILYGKSVTIQAQAGANGTGGVRWYSVPTGGSPIFTGTTYATPYYSTSLTYYIESFGTFGTQQCTSSRVAVSVARPSNPAIQTEQIRVPSIVDEAQINTLNQTQKNEMVSYLDGLGRVIQQVQVKMTPASRDIITPVEYDATGRISNQYLPYTITSTDGLFQAVFKTQQTNFYTGSGDKIADDTQPVGKTVYEASPLGRVLEQGSPGADFQPGSGHTTRLNYTFNDANEVRNITPNGSSTVFFAANTLQKSVYTNPDGKISITFTDGRGRTILKKQQLDETIGGVLVNYLETYYVYNNLNQLVFIITPKGVAGLKSGSWVFSATIKSELSYQFLYDEKGRIIEKKAPNQGWSFFVYDDLNRIVLMQDANLTSLNKWVYLKYDMKGRTVSAGLYKNVTQLTRAAVQTIVNGLYKASNATYPINSWYESKGTVLHGYTNVSFPKTNSDNTALEVLNVNYYDNYDFDNNGTADYGYTAQGLAGEGIATTLTQNLPTGNKRLVLGSANWLTSYVFYDSYHRPIQIRKNNHFNLDLAATPSLTTSVYDFEGKVLYSKNYHHAGTGKITTVVNRMEYDVKGRLIKVFQNNNAASADQLVAQYEYNELGQIVDKKLHNTTGTDFLQSIDYRYTIVGALSSINNAQLIADENNDDTNDFFGMEYLYNKVDAGLGNTALYGGNVSALKYKGPGAAAGITDQKSYKFQYDKSDKLKAATSQMYGTTAWNKELNTNNENLTYDFNGNIVSLTRNERAYQSLTTGYISQNIDNLTYTYNAGDKLTKVEDATSNTKGFANGANVATEYTYDAQGSLTGDQNKAISSITYNFLGKPAVINFASAKRIEYTYDAVGAKLTMKTFQGATLQSTLDYIDNFVYENGGLSFFSSPEGRVVKNGSNLEYQYTIADHQGNTRLLFTSATTAPLANSSNFEAATNSDFLNYTNGRTNFELFDHTDPTTDATDYSQKLAGVGNARVGIAKTYKVYPGDKVKIEAFAKYYNPTSTTINLTGYASALLSAFGLTAPVAGEVGTARAALNAWGALVEGGGGNGTSDFPKSFVTLLIFDKNYNPIDVAFDQINGGLQTGATPKAAHDYMAKEYVAKEEGYIYAYVSNENTTAVEVYFDDVQTTVTKTNVIQYNEYYPFGLQTSNSWTRENNSNNFLFNQASELNSNTNWYEMFYRGYDPAVGRMLQVDPYAQSYASISPYHYSKNNPVKFNDPTGGVVSQVYDYSISYSQWVEGNAGGDDGGGGGGGGGSGRGRRVGRAQPMIFSPWGGQENGAGEHRGEWIPLNSFEGMTLYNNKYGLDNRVVITGDDNSGIEATQPGAPFGQPQTSISSGPFTGSDADGTTYFEGVIVQESNLPFGSNRYSTPWAINVPADSKYDIDLLSHEFGHVLYYRKFGAKAFAEMALASMQSVDGGSHKDNWTEWTANFLSWQYFNAPSDWNHTEYPVEPSPTNPNYPPMSIFDFYR